MNELTNAIPDIVNLTSNIQKEEVKGFLENLIGEYGWLLFAAVLTILAKDMIMNFVQGLLVFMGNDFNNDDICDCVDNDSNGYCDAFEAFSANDNCNDYNDDGICDIDFNGDGNSGDCLDCDYGTTFDLIRFRLNQAVQ